MRACRAVFKLRLQLGMQYRAAALAGIATQFFFGLISIMVLDAFYSQTSSLPPISFSHVVTYIWLQQAFLAFIMLWFRDMEIFNLITTGNIAYELCRPCGIYGFWFAKLLAQRLSGAAMRCIPILAIAFLLPEPYSLGLPPDILTFAVFAAALLLGLLVLVAISMLLYTSVFYTMSPIGSLLLFATVGEFFAGMVIPLPLMPSWLQQIAYALPFHLTADFPFRVYSGNIPLQDAASGLGLQLIWLAGAAIAGAIWLRMALKRVVVQGG